MNKIDKLLYGGFGVVALAGIVAILVYVFSPPIQIVEEIVETPKIEVRTVKSIEDAPNQMEQWRQGVANARLQREQAEKDAERAALEEQDKARKEWWESRKDWVETIPV